MEAKRAAAEACKKAEAEALALANQRTKEALAAQAAQASKTAEAAKAQAEACKNEEAEAEAARVEAERLKQEETMMKGMSKAIRKQYKSYIATTTILPKVQENNEPTIRITKKTVPAAVSHTPTKPSSPHSPVSVPPLRLPTADQTQQDASLATSASARGVPANSEWFNMATPRRWQQLQSPRPQQQDAPASVPPLRLPTGEQTPRDLTSASARGPPAREVPKTPRQQLYSPRPQQNPPASVPRLRLPTGEQTPRNPTSGGAQGPGAVPNTPQQRYYSPRPQQGTSSGSVPPVRLPTAEQTPRGAVGPKTPRQPPYSPRPSGSQHRRSGPWNNGNDNAYADPHKSPASFADKPYSPRPSGSQHRRSGPWSNGYDNAYANIHKSPASIADKLVLKAPDFVNS